MQELLLSSRRNRVRMCAFTELSQCRRVLRTADTGARAGTAIDGSERLLRVASRPPGPGTKRMICTTSRRVAHGEPADFNPGVRDRRHSEPRYRAHRHRIYAGPDTLSSGTADPDAASTRCRAARFDPQASSATRYRRPRLTGPFPSLSCASPRPLAAQKGFPRIMASAQPVRL
jgi:hypothetical protein